MSTNDVKGLAGLVNDEVRKLQQHTQDVRDRLQKQLTEAHEVVTHVGDMSDTLGNAVAELKAALGQHTNGPPVEGK